tara:strand:+ start:1278 stop:1484 length:207 start_codon:yes stop_codon:yes gene_type:complete
MYKYQTKDGEIIEVKQSIPRHTQKVLGLKNIRHDYQKEQSDFEDRREWAMEEGMLQGLGAYNEIMGND